MRVTSSVFARVTAMMICRCSAALIASLIAIGQPGTPGRHQYLALYLGFLQPRQLAQTNHHRGRHAFEKFRQPRYADLQGEAVMMRLRRRSEGQGDRRATGRPRGRSRPGLGPRHPADTSSHGRHGRRGSDPVRARAGQSRSANPRPSSTVRECKPLINLENMLHTKSR